MTINNNVANNKAKKVLQIKKGEYLLDVLNSGAINTTYNIDVALDISNWDLEMLGYIVSNLKKVGYSKADVLTIKDEDKEIEEVEEDV